MVLFQLFHSSFFECACHALKLKVNYGVVYTTLIYTVS